MIRDRVGPKWEGGRREEGGGGGGEERGGERRGGGGREGEGEKVEREGGGGRGGGGERRGGGGRENRPRAAARATGHRNRRRLVADDFDCGVVTGIGHELGAEGTALPARNDDVPADGENVRRHGADAFLYQFTGIVLHGP